jgi:hypothetical protein
MTPAMLESRVGAGGPPASGAADVAEMTAPALLGTYHAWNIKNSFPVPGSMVVDDYRRRFLSMYASSEERALVPQRHERERAAEVKVAVLGRMEEHRLPTEVEALLGKRAVRGCRRRPPRERVAPRAAAACGHRPAAAPQQRARCGACA